MRARVEALSPRALTALAAAAVLLFAVVVWLLVVSPKRADASSAGAELAAAELLLSEAQAALLRPQARGTSVSDVLRLTKAMPSSDDQAGLVLELTRLAKTTGVTLKRITQEPLQTEPGKPATIPLSIVVSGRYPDVTRFLMRVRELVTVQGGKISARGRLLSVNSVSLDESDTGGFPQLDATIALDSYVYDGPIAPEAPPVPTEEEGTGGSSAAGSGS